MVLAYIGFNSQSSSGRTVYEGFWILQSLTVTLKWKNKQNKGSWVAHSSHNWLNYIIWNHTIRGRATKPVLPRQCRNEYPAACLSLLQVVRGDRPVPTKLCLPGAVHVRPLCWSRRVLDDEKHHPVSKGLMAEWCEIKFAPDMQIFCNVINMNSGWGSRKTFRLLSVSPQ